MSLIILSFDPGSRHSGVIVRRGEELVDWRVVKRRSDGPDVDGAYLREVVEIGESFIEAALHDLDDVPVTAVEGLAWWPQKGVPRNQLHLYSTAMVVGAILYRWPDAIVVPSGRGVAMLHEWSYPAAIRPKGQGKGVKVHARASWDHSFFAESEFLRRQRTLESA